MRAHAWLLDAFNFTPPSRTPWGGTRIATRFKGLEGDAARAVVGESWELSACEDFPSRVEGDGATLAEVLARDPAWALGDEATAGGTSLLVKLLDAADELSVQIHPRDDYAGLAARECGKPESWYVVEADPGAGIYLGLAEGVTREALREALEGGGDVASMLGFVPVAPGDFFVVEAGVAHAIGRGVTLVEPQVVRPGRSGVTYRYWDWNRRYDRAGRPSPEGSPRPLHVAHALAVTAWEAPRGEGFLREARVRAGAARVEGALRVTALCGRDAALAAEHLEVSRVEGSGARALGAAGRVRGVTVLEGALRIEGEGPTVEVARGRTAAIAAGAAVTLHGARVHAVLSSTR